MNTDFKDREVWPPPGSPHPGELRLHHLSVARGAEQGGQGPGGDAGVSPALTGSVVGTQR